MDSCAGDSFPLMVEQIYLFKIIPPKQIVLFVIAKSFGSFWKFMQTPTEIECKHSKLNFNNIAPAKENQMKYLMRH